MNNFLRSLKILVVVFGTSLFTYSCCFSINGHQNFLREERSRINKVMISTIGFVKLRNQEDIEQEPKKGRWSRPYCSGFFVSRTEIVSAAHCFQDRLEIGPFTIEIPTELYGKRVSFVRYGQINDDGVVVQHPQTAIIKWANEEQDVVILKIDTNVRPAREWFRVAKREPLVGETVYVCGHALGLSWTFTTGIVTRVWHRTIKTPTTLIQTQAPAFFGNSGGPLINERGEAIGVAHALTGNQAVINFFVGIDQVRKGLNTMRR